VPFQNREPGDPRSRRNMPIAEQKSCLLGGRAATRRRRRSELRSHPKEEAMSHALATVRHGGRRPPVNPKSEIRNSRDGWVASDPFPYPYPFPSPTGRVGRHSLPLSSRARPSPFCHSDRASPSSERRNLFDSASASLRTSLWSGWLRVDLLTDPSVRSLRSLTRDDILWGRQPVTA